MKDDAEIRLVLDTRQAKDELGKLGHTRGRIQRHQASRKAGARLHAEWLGRAAGVVGGLFATLRSIKPAGGNVDVWEEAIGVIGNDVSTMADKMLGYVALARTQARKETAESYAMFVGGGGDINVAVKAYQKLVPIYERDQRGLFLIRSDPQLRGPSITELLAKAIPAYLNMIERGRQAILDAITGKGAGK